jgi:hypothetical protein
MAAMAGGEARCEVEWSGGRGRRLVLYGRGGCGLAVRAAGAAMTVGCGTLREGERMAEVAVGMQ